VSERVRIEIQTPQGTFSGYKNTTTPNGLYFATRGGLFDKDDDDYDDLVCLSGPDGFLFFAHGTIRPFTTAVSNFGTMVVGDRLKLSNELKCRVLVYSQTGERLFSKRFQRNCSQVGISPEGRIVVVGTMNPGSCIRVIEVASARVISKVEGCLFDTVHVDEQARTITDTRHDGQVFKFSW